MATFSEQEYQDFLRFVQDGTIKRIVDRYLASKHLSSDVSFGPLDHDVVIIDTEATGLSIKNDELTQIAAARIEGDAITDWYVTFVNPDQDIPDDIVRLTGITQDDVADAPFAPAAVEGLVDFVGRSKIVAHNVEFDQAMITKHAEGECLLDNTWIDSLQLSRIVFPKLKSHRLTDLCQTFETFQSTHRADADVTATHKLYRILLDAVSRLPIDLTCAIAKLSPDNTWPTKVVFDYFATQYCQEHPLEVEQLFRTYNLKQLRYNQLKALPKVYKTQAQKGGQSEPIGGLASADAQSSHPLDSAESIQDSASGSATPPKPYTADFMEGDRLTQAFSSDGLLSAVYPGFEQRHEQIDMATEVGGALAQSSNLVLEAGTGVGKSMAYLAPGVLFALENGVTLGVATKTNTLLDQLVYQELPSLSKALERTYGERPLAYASLKGISHYPCLRKIQKMLDDGLDQVEVLGKMVDPSASFAALLSFIEQSTFDDIDTLKIDYKVMPRWKITSGSNECIKKKCPFYGNACFTRGARNRAENVDVVVTNHTMVFCDIEADGTLLPPIKHWVVDEAHSAEDEARRSFTKTADCQSLDDIAHKLSPEHGSRTVLARLKTRIGAQKSSGRRAGLGVHGTGLNEETLNSTSSLFEELAALEDPTGQLGASMLGAAQPDANTSTNPNAAAPGEADTLLYAGTNLTEQAAIAYGRCLETYCQALKAFGEKYKRNKSYDRYDVWISTEIRSKAEFIALAEAAAALIDAIDKLMNKGSMLISALELREDLAEYQRELAVCFLELASLRDALETVYIAHPDTNAYQATLDKRYNYTYDNAQAIPLSVAETMQSRFFERVDSAIFTSATLTVNHSFNSFISGLGLDLGEVKPKTRMLESSYDFDNNMVIYVVDDMPDPREAGYMDALNDLLIKTHIASQGSMLTLFTNRREMEHSFEVVKPALKEKGLFTICQKWGVSVKGLRDEFIKDEHLSLFALKSFWEGFDAPGDTLKGVIIPKLPFGRPDDPLYKEREQRDRTGAWKKYELTRAVIETKQAAGRLIRRADDTGVLILADSRLISKWYGKTFLNSLQSRTIRKCSRAELVKSLELLRKG